MLCTIAMYVSKNLRVFRNSLNLFTTILLKNQYLPSIYQTLVYVEYNARKVIIITYIQINIFNVKCLWLNIVPSLESHLVLYFVHH